MDRHVEAFLEMLAAERGAARNTLDGVSSRSGRFCRLRRRTRPAAGAVRCGAVAGLHGRPAPRGSRCPHGRAAFVGSATIPPVSAARRCAHGRSHHVARRTASAADTAEIPERTGGRGAAGLREASSRAARRTRSGGTGDSLRDRTAGVGTAGIATPSAGQRCRGAADPRQRRQGAHRAAVRQGEAGRRRTGGGARRARGDTCFPAATRVAR